MGSVAISFGVIKATVDSHSERIAHLERMIDRLLSTAPGKNNATAAQ